MNTIDTIMGLADEYARTCAINTVQHSGMESRQALRAAIEQALSNELERIAHEPPISGNELAQARVLMAAAALRQRSET